MKASHFLVRQESGKEVSALAGLRPSFRFQRNRAGRSHAARVLHRAQNSLRSFRGPARKPGPCRDRARHFAFSETGQAVKLLRFLLCVSAENSGFPEQGNGLYFLITKKVTKKFRNLPLG